MPDLDKYTNTTIVPSYQPPPLVQHDQQLSNWSTVGTFAVLLLGALIGFVTSTMLSTNQLKNDLTNLSLKLMAEIEKLNLKLSMKEVAIVEVREDIEQLYSNFQEFVTLVNERLRIKFIIRKK